MKILSWILIVIGVAGIGAGTIVGGQAALEMKARGTEIAAIEVTQDSVRAELRETNLLYRGHQEGIKQMPDSLRMQQSGIIVERSKRFNKMIIKYENEDREFVRRIKRLEKRREGAAARVRWWGGIFGGGGLAVLILGVALARRAP